MKYVVTLITFFIISLLFSFSYVTATDCWLYDDDETTCNSFDDCTYHLDEWGGWCEEVGCWNYHTEIDCPTSVSGTNKYCTWQSSSDSGWCEQTNCFSFEGTNITACESNSAGLTCDWYAECHGWNEEIDCWDLNETRCGEIEGCMWGRCEDQGCWSYYDQTSCTSARGSRGYSCTWNSNSNYCYEAGCWDYSGTNESTCESNTAGIPCEWVDNYYVHESCEEPACWHYDYTNQTACESNAAGLNCSWSATNGWCEEEGCWNYNSASQCAAATGCTWRTSTGSGWCEEVNCWTWDGCNGGNQNTCENNAYNISCAWDATGNWCYPNITAECSDFTTERECMDTYYCWWQFNDYMNTSGGGTCQDPADLGTSGTFFEEFNPSCYVFDRNSTNCDNVLGCTHDGSVCNVDDTHANAATIHDRGINCTMINSSSLCNNIQVLASCCQWGAGSCSQNKMTTSCWDDAQATPEGVQSCADVMMETSDSSSAKTLCEQVAGDPWYLPCVWENETKSCKFMANDVFGARTQNYAFLDNEATCKAANGMWIVENYCEGNISVPVGRCEQKGSDETNCHVACFACEYKKDGTGHNSTRTAREYCYNSKLGYCEFIEDTSAPNGFGFCKAKEEFKKGIATDCRSDCGSCTFMGNPNAASEYDGDKKSYDVCNTPKCFCQQAYEFENVKCKWVTDSSSDIGGYCVASSEKTCADACDRCYTNSDCQNVGRSALGLEGSCSWEGEGTNGYCVKSGEESEICWDAIDNDDDNLIDCADSECFADSFCGFVSGDCFGWSTQTDCESNGCTWMTDPWGSWCDFGGADCWKHDGNETACDAANSCEWTAGEGSGQCEQDWSIGEDCYSQMTEAACNAVITTNCTWTDDTWCEGEGSSTDWCTNYGGWCDPAAFAPKDCWQYDSNQTGCVAADGCAWESKDWAGCEIDWSSSDCYMYSSQSTCEANECSWRTDSGGSGSGWCDNKFQVCWDYSQAECDHHSNLCYWESWGDSGSCEALCFDRDLTESTCNAIDGCAWTTGWCMEDWSAGGVNCWDENITDNQTACDEQDSCAWKSPGWCNPTGFSGGDAYSGMGGGAQMGMDCWRYDGNEDSCTNDTLTGMSCEWMPEYKPFCEPDWSANCWQYDWNATQCDAQNACRWRNETGANGYCQNIFDQCWDNTTLSGSENECNNNAYCNWTNSHCEPTCFSYSTEGTCPAECRWMNGWCNPPGQYGMFQNMQMGAPVMLAYDDCNEVTISAVVDLCGVGLKDMDSSFGFGGQVRDFSNAAICNQEKLLTGGIGSGNLTAKMYIFLDSDGEETGSCALSHDSSSKGYEFMFKYITRWNTNTSKAEETFNAYKCSSGSWVAADISLDAWKEKMCMEVGGPMIAVEKIDLEKFPTLYDPDSDMRVFVSTADGDHNASSPSDYAGPGWLTPGAIDFEMKGVFEYNSNAAKFEDILKTGFVAYEDCFNGVDDDDDDMIDCNDWDCEFAPHCANVGVNAADYADTSMPRIRGTKVEEYPDAALVMFNTDKPTNGTLIFWYTDQTCSNNANNRTLYDIGITSSDVREYKMWHTIDIYNDGGVASLDYAIAANTTYYYKIKICDSSGKCSQSKCTSLRTVESADKCGGFCNFVTRINVPTGWTIAYDLDQDETYEHIQGQMCGPKAGMKTNYTSGRKADIKLYSTEGSTIWFFNASLTRTGLSKDTRKINTAGDLIAENTTDADGNLVGMVGMISGTRDKIINNLHPEVCHIKIPNEGNCTELWHCDDDGDNCVNMTDDATLINGTETGFCTWKIPYCEFSTWATGEPGGSVTTGGDDSGTTSSASASSDSSSGGSTAKAATTTTIEETATTTTIAPTTTTKKPIVTLPSKESVYMNMEWILVGIVVIVFIIILILKFGRKPKT